MTRIKSGRFRKRTVKVPGGRTVTRYLERKPKQARCAATGAVLHGIPRRDATRAKNAPKTTKRPERPYGGVLSSRAMRKKFLEEAVMLAAEPKIKAPLFTVGRVCLKIAGRDAGKRCVIVEVQGDDRVLIDGETRRRACNLRHLEPLPDVVKLKAGAKHEEVVKAFTELGITLRETTPKKAGERPKKVRKASAKKGAVETTAGAKRAKAVEERVREEAEPKSA